MQSTWAFQLEYVSCDSGRAYGTTHGSKLQDRQFWLLLHNLSPPPRTHAHTHTHTRAHTHWHWHWHTHTQSLSQAHLKIDRTVGFMLHSLNISVSLQHTENTPAHTDTHWNTSLRHNVQTDDIISIHHSGGNIRYVLLQYFTCALNICIQFCWHNTD